ncbi:2-hydroxyacyl-CoA dehydratase [Tannockella kyphosi]|uniref:2-hydroxyacyl-CoA dehydratase n=1 Tax=Tannockella kyphosi TaxID=2899121 RepID=UPI0024B388D1|nr:2-hydroxyacyl-CoA dehydratase [Tannockella kyphosi]
MDRVEFTKEMKKTHKILVPNMLNVHFKILEKIFTSYGYTMEILTNTDQSVIDEGLKYIHNDTCYPALLTSGQMISALKSGDYDLEHTALIMSQTGGGCRASNYIHLLRKGLRNAGLGDIPVISINMSGLEKNSGFKLSLPLIRRMVAAAVYGDLLMLLSNQVRPYEIKKGQTDTLLEQWTVKISELFEQNKGYSQKEMKKYLKEMSLSFEEIEIKEEKKVKVGIVGEIYVKYSPLANNNLEKFLQEQDCEVMVPGLMGFMLFKVDNRIEDIKLYGGNKIKDIVCKKLFNFLTKYETYLIESLQGTRFTPPGTYQHLKKLVEPVIGYGCKMGEGWLLTAEMLELAESGYGNIVCAQPFGCLPNHIAGKGMVRKIVKQFPKANIVAIDYDPGATKVNQENRIKLMLSVAKENL